MGLEGTEITKYIEDHINVANILKQAAPIWDGGYVLCGVTGSGEMFTLRDPWGIRPAFWYKDDELLVVASERPVIQTSLDLEAEEIHELKPGEGLIMSKDGKFRTEQILTPKNLAACSFEGYISHAVPTKTSIKKGRHWDALWWRPFSRRWTANSTKRCSPTSPTRPKRLTTDCWKASTISSTSRKWKPLPPWGLTPTSRRWQRFSTDASARKNRMERHQNANVHC